MRSKIRAMMLVAVMSVFSVFSVAAPGNADAGSSSFVVAVHEAVLVDNGAGLRVTYTLACQHPTGDPGVHYSPPSITQKINSKGTATGSGDYDSGTNPESMPLCSPSYPYYKDVVVPADSIPFENGKADLTISYGIFETDPFHRPGPSGEVTTEVKIKK